MCALGSLYFSSNCCVEVVLTAIFSVFALRLCSFAISSSVFRVLLQLIYASQSYSCSKISLDHLS